jgi:ligand-binding sensor domain-containing protein
MMFARAVGNELIVPVTGNGLHRWTLKEGFTLIPGSRELGNHAVVGIQEIDGGLLLGTSNAVYTLKGQELLSLNETLNERLKKQEINRLLLLKDGTLAIGTINNGVYLFTPSTEEITHLSEKSNLSNNTVLALFESRAGNLWLALVRQD